LLVWKMEPSRTRRSRSSRALTRLPLCATAIWPCAQSMRIGCALRSLLSPAVEYRVWPMAMCPGSASSARSSNASATCPMAREMRIFSPSALAMPALSWPRCWRAYSPRYVRLAASGCPKMPKTPHSSLYLSRCSLASLARVLAAPDAVFASPRPSDGGTSAGVPSRTRFPLSGCTTCEVSFDGGGPGPLGVAHRDVDRGGWWDGNRQPVAARRPDPARRDARGGRAREDLLLFGRVHRHDDS